MALSVKKGSFQAPTSTGNSAVTGVGFQPSVVILWGTNGAAAGYKDGAATSVGFCQSSSARKTFGVASDDGSTGANAASRYADLAITILSAGTPTVGAEADFVSMDADGFTLDWTTAGVGKDYIVHYLALGGSAVESVKVGEVTAPTSTGAQAVTGVGFQPDLILLLGNHQTATGNSTSFSSLTLAAGTSSSARGTASAEDRDAQNPTAVAQYQRTDKVYAVRAAALAREGDLTSMDADGFTFNWTTGTTAHKIAYLALKGPLFKVGAETQQTSVATKATTGVGFQPKGLMMWGFGRDATTSPDATASHLSVGGTDGTTSGCTWMQSQDNVATANTHSATVTNKAYRLAELGSTTAEAGLASFDADGFTLDWTTADATARQFLYLAIGEPEESPSGPTFFNVGIRESAGIILDA